MEKPKLHRFTGDVRDYAIFKADFKHIVEARYGKRDAITILTSSLLGKPLDMIKGIGHDYDAAWDYLIRLGIRRPTICCGYNNAGHFTIQAHQGK